jgi:hypothetical protein
MATHEHIAQIVLVLNAMYPDDVAFLTREQIAARTATYCRLLVDLDADMLSLAADQYIASASKKYPTVGQIRELVLSMGRNADGAPDAATAWRMACDAIEPMGYGYRVKPGASLHPRVLKAVDAFGVFRLGSRLDENAGTDFAQWRSVYETLTRRDEEQAQWLPAVKDRIATMRAQLEAQKTKQNIQQLEAPVIDEKPRPAGGMPVSIRDLLAQKASEPALTKDQLDRRARAAQLTARRDLLREQLRSETDEAKRRALEITIDGLTRSVAQYEGLFQEATS